MLNRRWALLILLLSALTFAAQPVPKQQESFAAYWSSEPGWMTELQLKNNLATKPLTVTPVLRLASGREIPLDATTISPNASVSVWVNEGLLAHASELLSQPGSYGSLVFRYTSGGALNLHATVVVSMQGEPISIAVPAYPERYNLNTPRGNSAGSLEGIWWQPRSGLSDVLVIGNHSDRKLSGRLSLFDAAGKQWSETLVLAPRETLRMSTSSLVQKAGLSGNYGGISFAVPAASSALQGVHFVYNEISKFSETLELSPHDPNTTLQERAGRDAKYWTMYAPMLALRNPDPGLGMPRGTVLEPTILVRNTTGKPVSADLALTWRSDSTKGQVKLPALQLPPFATQQLQIGAMQELLRIPNSASWALVSLKTDALPDDLVAIASSPDASGRYSLDTRFVGGIGGHFAGGEWRADANQNVIAAVTNTGTKPTDALLTLHYDNGGKKYELQQTIAPDDQIWMNLSQLIRNRVTDRRGNTLPVDVSSVTYEVRDQTPAGHNLRVDSLSADTTYGFHAITPYGNCCGYMSGSFGLDPGLFDLFVGISDSAWIYGENGCTDQEDDISAYFPTWGSDNSNVAKVTYKNVKGMAVGTTTGTANGNLLIGVGGYCAYDPEQVTAPITVVNVTLSIQSTGTPATDNSARDAYNSENGTYNLGPIIAAGQECSIGYQVTGTVTPSDYTGTINLVRTKSGISYWGSNGEVVNTTYPTGTPDTSEPQFEDTNPQSGGSGGKVYDLDAPGVIPAVSQVGRIRYNLVENAQLPDGTYAATELQFYVRLSCSWGSTGNSFRNDVTGDNVLGTGTTKTSWNLQ